MVLGARERSYNSEQELIGGSNKRAKTATMDIDVEMADATIPRPSHPASAGLSNTLIKKSANAGMKGRKRFNKDLSDVQASLKTSPTPTLFGLRTAVKNGDDEGSFILSLSHDGQKVVELTYLISETSDYPSDHTFFTYTDSPPSNAGVVKAQEAIAEREGMTVQDEVVELAFAVAKALSLRGLPSAAWAGGATQADSDDELEDDGEEYDPFEGMTDDEDTGMMNSTTLPKKLNYSLLRQHFHNIVNCSYRPGVTSFSSDDYVLTISVPLTSLTSESTSKPQSDVYIPAQALMAWDRRLLEHPYHFTLLMHGLGGVYPLKGQALKFRVGLTKGGYKPNREQAREASRKFGLVKEDTILVPPSADSLEDVPQYVAEEEEDDEGHFERFSLSDSLEALLDQKFLRILALRESHQLTWGGAEKMFEFVEGLQYSPEVVAATPNLWAQVTAAESTERLRARELPYDPFPDDPTNLPLIAFTYTLRRLLLCTDFCVVCHNELQLETEGEVLKPYVCKKDLCRYQYYVMGAGPSLEYEIIHNPATVDLLVSLCYVAAVEQVMDEPWPTGMAIRVPWSEVTTATAKLPPKRSHHTYSMTGNNYNTVAPEDEEVKTLETVLGRPATYDVDEVVDFDKLGKSQMRAIVSVFLERLPSVTEMRKHLIQKTRPGKTKPKLADLDVPAESWNLLRWVIGSCTAYIEEIRESWEQIGGLDPSWRQFRFVVGAPDKEAKFQGEFGKARKSKPKYPSTYAFHGSPLRNWHSIIRHGLWHKEIAHGRAFGNGVYLAKEGQTSMGGYAQGSSRAWKNSTVGPLTCTALAEIINLPEKYVSNNPHIVIADNHWIMCRYLIVKCASLQEDEEPIPDPSSYAFPDSSTFNPTPKKKPKKKKVVSKPQLFAFDPAQKITMNNKSLEIPVPEHRVNTMVRLMVEEEEERGLIDVDDEDRKVFNWEEPKDEEAKKAAKKGKEKVVIEISDDEEDDVPDWDDDGPMIISKSNSTSSTSKFGSLKSKLTSFASSSSKPKPPKDDWKHDAAWVSKCTENLFPPPVNAAPSATNAVQRELRSMLKEQKDATSLKELGWYFPEEFIGDNLFQWIVEMHSFDPELPIAKDMKEKKLNSIVFEVRFPPTFPMSPPFFMIKSPRFLPFIQGGGGHVTGGGSICMDLLTANGWLPSYSIPAVLLQIKMAISNLDPRPARLARDWDRAYNVHEALEGYKRAAATHGWTVPTGLEMLIR